MKKITLFLALAFALLGCEAGIGDSCSTSNDCPTGLVCDTDSPSGYCLVSGCEFDEECPENATCVAFTKDIHYCLKKCKSSKDCRGNYTCRDDIGTTKFCYVAPEFTYGRVDDNEIPFEVSSQENAE